MVEIILYIYLTPLVFIILMEVLGSQECIKIFLVAIGWPIILSLLLISFIRHQIVDAKRKRRDKKDYNTFIKHIKP
jgi:positive regulator of sigma E activity